MKHASLALSLALAFAAAFLVSSAGGEDWLHWRGPDGNSAAASGANPPLSWSETENVAWKVAVPGRGSASPVVWGDRIFVATAVPADADAGSEPGEGSAPSTPSAPRGGRGRAEGGEGSAGVRPGGRRGRGGSRGGGETAISVQRFTLLCYDRSSGKLLWERVAAETQPTEGHHHDHGFASASPMTDGERVYAHFGSRGIFAYTLEGEPAWAYTEFEPMRTRSGFGEGSSPALHGDTVLIPWDHEGDSYLLALDKKSGTAKWKAARPGETTTWGTPLAVRHEGRTQVVLTGQGYVRSYDLETGEELWRCSGQTERPVASPVSLGELVFVGSGFRGAYLGAFHLGGRGDLGGSSSVVWSVDRNTPDIPSPALSDGRLYYLAGRECAVTCLDALTGNVHFERERIDGVGQVYASPVAAGGHLYIFGRDGTAAVIRDSEEFSLVGLNRLGEGVDVTPAATGGDLIVRGERHLYRISATE